MNFYNDDVVRSEAAERRSRLLHEAAQHRSRQHSRRQHSRRQHRPAPTRSDRLLAALGDRLVAWGERLRQRRTAWHAAQAANQERELAF